MEMAGVGKGLAILGVMLLVIGSVLMVPGEMGRFGKRSGLARAAAG